MNHQNLRMPIEILSRNGDTLMVKPTENVDNCPKCAAGEGCGKSQWFRGFFKMKSFSINTKTKIVGNFAELQLPSTIFSVLCITTYALPLLAFFIALFLSSALPQWLQFILGILSAAAFFYLGKNFALRLIQKNLQILEIEHGGMEKSSSAKPVKETDL